jgi:hypothetical protein
MTDSHSFTLTLEQEEGFDFRVQFDWPGNADLLLDEPEPLRASARAFRWMWRWWTPPDARCTSAGKSPR